MKRITAAAALALSALALSPVALPAVAVAQQAAPAGTDVYDMSCAVFHHNPDGSWNTTRDMTLQPAAGPIPLKPSFKFKPGTLFAGFDLGAELDKACLH